MDVAEAGIDLMSPDNTTDGWLRKKWAIIDGKRCLIKGGSGVMQQEPYNEFFAGTVMERLGIAHVPYALMEQDGYPYSADTLEWGGAAPIYDSGTSLWFSTPTGFIGGNGARLTCKPFKTSHEEQLKLVTSFDWLELHQLSGIEDEFRSIVGNSLFLDANRVDVICRAITKRVDMLQAHVNTRVEAGTASASVGDVLKDEAYSGNENA